MSIIYTFNNKVLKNSANDKWLIKKESDPYNPLDLPPNVIRVKYQSGSRPHIGDVSRLVDVDGNIWDIFIESNNWSNLAQYNNELVEVLGANTTNVTNMESMFTYCTQLTTVSLFDTSNVTNMSRMFDNCGQLTSIPLFNTSKVTNMNYTFNYCTHVDSGALALYQQASSQTNPPTYHDGTFNDCGNNSETGRVELAQIPASWGGLA